MSRLGSSNTWVGAGKKYVKTKTSKSTGATVVSRVNAPITAVSLTTFTYRPLTTAPALSPEKNVGIYSFTYLPMLY